MKNYRDIITKIKNKEYSPVYFLAGEESYFIDEIANMLEELVLNETEKQFNLTVLYGKDSNVEQIRDIAYRAPMMAPYNLVLVREAQYLRNLIELESYVKKPVPSTILVFLHKNKNLDKRTRFSKELVKTGTILQSDKLKEDQVPAWIENWAKRNKVVINNKAQQVLVEYVGNDLAKLSNELNKLKIHKNDGDTIDMDDVEKYIGINKDFNVVELVVALSNRNGNKLYKTVRYFSENQKAGHIQLVIGFLNNFFSRLYTLKLAQNLPFNQQKALVGWISPDISAGVKNYSIKQIENAISVLNEYDLKSKGLGNNTAAIKSGELLIEMIYRIVNFKSEYEISNNSLASA